MSDPKLLAVKSTISYKSDDGFCSEETIGSMRQGVHDPIEVLTATVREGVRLLALFGHSDKAQEITSEAIGAVSIWRAQRAAAQKGQ